MQFDQEKWFKKLMTASREELKKMRVNAMYYGRNDLVKAVEVRLDTDFRGWRRKKAWQKAVPTRASFKGECYDAKSQVDAYMWIFRKFFNERPDIIDNKGWQNDFVSRGRCGRFFARTPNELWEKSSHLVEEDCWEWVNERVCANTNLSWEQKIKNVRNFAAVAGWNNYEFRLLDNLNYDEGLTLDDLFRDLG